MAEKSLSRRIAERLGWSVEPLPENWYTVRDANNEFQRTVRAYTVDDALLEAGVNLCDTDTMLDVWKQHTPIGVRRIKISYHLTDEKRWCAWDYWLEIYHSSGQIGELHEEPDETLAHLLARAWLAENERASTPASVTTPADESEDTST